ncbi:MAG: hypothetical protein GY858_01395 [Candidatus Omnitrophica bacterium]|nr:hypothetical protein [Candidatus Omnitrophota bacterium]
MIFKHKRKKIGLALGSGAARGLSHIGVLNGLGESGIAIDMIAGTSMGALVGAYYAKHLEVKGLEEIVLALDFKNILKLADPNFFFLFQGFVSGNKVEEFLKLLIGDIDFKDLKIPLWIIATDIQTGEEVIINEGSVVKAVRASISIPAIFTPVSHNGRVLIDGGIVNPLPANVLRQKGADFILASDVVKKPKSFSNVTSGQSLLTEKASAASKTVNEGVVKLSGNRDLFGSIKGFVKNFIDVKEIEERKGIPSIFETILNALYTMEYQVVKTTSQAADLIITPATDHIATLEFYRAREIVWQGYKACVEVVDKNKKQLSKITKCRI